MFDHPLYFIRHGETDWNAEGRLQGQKDIPLNDLGKVQAEEAGLILKALCPQPDDLDWWVSPLGRTRETAERARGAVALHPTNYKTDDRLKELTFGAWEGKTWKEVRRTDPQRAAQREHDKWRAVPPDGESYAMLLDRVSTFLPAIRRPTVLVSHGGVARVLMHRLGGITPAKAASADIRQGQVLVFEGGRCRWVDTAGGPVAQGRMA